MPLPISVIAEARRAALGRVISGALTAPICIHGFRGDNLAVEVVEVAPSQRGALTMQLLSDEARRQGIVYTPTRAQATSLAD